MPIINFSLLACNDDILFSQYALKVNENISVQKLVVPYLWLLTTVCDAAEYS